MVLVLLTADDDVEHLRFSDSSSASKRFAIIWTIWRSSSGRTGAANSTSRSAGSSRFSPLLQSTENTRVKSRS